jgi:hypothetical protein
MHGRTPWWIVASILLAGDAHAQTSGSAPAQASAVPAREPWAFALTVDGNFIPQNPFYVSPTVTADHGWLHLEARGNYESQHSGSVWVGHNSRIGEQWVFQSTWVVGGVFGDVTGIAPGFELSLQHGKFVLSSTAEYVFETNDRSRSFFYSEPQLTYALLEWLRIGLATQRTQAYHTKLDTQRGFLVGLSHGSLDFTTFVFNLGWTDPSVVVELVYGF